MKNKRNMMIALTATMMLVLMTTSSLWAQKSDSKEQSYLAKAKAFSKMTGRPIFVVAGSKT